MLHCTVLFLGVKSISLNRFRFQNLVHMILCVEMVRLNFRRVGEAACFHSIDCCLDDGVTLEISLIASHILIQQFVTLGVVSTQKCQSTNKALGFILLGQHFWYPPYKHLLLTQAFSNNFIQSGTRDFRKHQRKIGDRKTCIGRNFVINLKNQLIIPRPIEFGRDYSQLMAGRLSFHSTRSFCLN